MPVTIKSSQVKVKGTDGYVGVDALADSTTASRVAAINSAGADVLEDIQDLGTTTEEAVAQAAAAARASIPSEYTQLSDDVSGLKSAIGNITGNPTISFSDPTLKQYINTSGSTVSWDTPSTSVATNIKWAVVECSPGDQFTINGKGGNSDRLWAFADSSKNILDKASANATGTNLLITAPASSAYLIINDETNKISYVGKLIRTDLSEEKAERIANDENTDKLLNHITENNKNLLPVWNKTTNPSNVTVTYTAGKLKLYGTSNGSSVSYDYSACEPITLSAGTYTFSRGTASAQETLRKVIGTSATNVAVLQGSTNSATFTLSETTTLYLYVGLTNGSSYDAELPLQLETGSRATYWVIPKLSAIDAIAREDAEHKTRLSLEWTSGKAFIYNAGWSNNSGWSYADVILTQGEAVIVSLNVGMSVYPLSVWSDDGNSIIKTCFPVSDTAEYKTLTYVCSADKERVRINVQNTNKANVIAEKYNVGDLLNQSNIESVKNAIPCFDVLYDSIIAIGDSLTQGSYTGSDLHTSQSYPAFLAKTMCNNVENAGRAGWTTLQWWEGDSTSQKGFPYYSYGNYDAAVICLGTNSGLTDTLATDVDPYDDYHDYADTNTGAYCKIIEGILAQNSGLIIFLCNIWAGGGTGGVSVTNEVIGKIATKYSLPVIDLKSELMTAYSVYHAVSGNIHLGRIGYAKMAGIIREKLNDYVLTNPTKFNYIPS